jgi:hypothetical protein
MTGSFMVNALPPSGRFDAVIVPAWARAIALTIASPSPAPPVERSRLA